MIAIAMVRSIVDDLMPQAREVFPGVDDDVLRVEVTVVVMKRLRGSGTLGGWPE